MERVSSSQMLEKAHKDRLTKACDMGSERARRLSRLVRCSMPRLDTSRSTLPS